MFFLKYAGDAAHPTISHHAPDCSYFVMLFFCEHLNTIYITSISIDILISNIYNNAYKWHYNYSYK